MKMTHQFSAMGAAILALILVGCATPNPAVSYASQGKRLYGKKMTAEALDAFNRSADYDATIMAHKRYAKHRVMYEDVQVQHGLTAAEAAEAAGDLIAAWSWYHCVAQVNPDREECKAAAGHAERIAGSIPEAHLAKARAAAESGDRIGAYAWIAQSAIVTGDEDAEALLEEITSDAPFDGHLPKLPRQDISATVRPPVRTDLIDRLNGKTVDEVDGIAVYFGEPRAYYEALGETQLSGPTTVVLPALAARAKKKGGNALVNVSHRYKGETPVTTATIARLLRLDTDGPSQ